MAYDRSGCYKISMVRMSVSGLTNLRMYGSKATLPVERRKLSNAGLTTEKYV